MDIMGWLIDMAMAIERTGVHDGFDGLAKEKIREIEKDIWGERDRQRDRERDI